MLRRRINWLSCLVIIGVAGCVQTPHEYEIRSSRMAADFEDARFVSDEPEARSDDVSRREGGLNRLEPMVLEQRQFHQQQDAAQGFRDNDEQLVAANELSVRDFVETVFGELLEVNYIITEEARATSGAVTLNIGEPVSSRRLFLIASELLSEKNLRVTLRDDIFYISQHESRRREQPVLGLGRQRGDVPDTIQPILQVIPLRYGITTSIERTLSTLTDAQINSDIEQGALFVQGSRNEIMRVLDLVNILDVPANRGKHIGFYHLNYISVDEFIDTVTELLSAEGVRAGTSRGSSDSSGLLLIPVEQVGAVAAFSGELQLIERMEYWARQIDKPSRGAEQRYYVYHPRYARASDLGESVAPLLGDFDESGAARDTQSALTGRQPVAGSQPSSSQQRGNGRNQPNAISVSAEGMRMTVDERSNSLIFYTTGEAYQSLLPIIRRLDVMPKQILLDATIAEVTLTDEFAQGFEFAFRDGNFNGGTMGALGAGSVGGLTVNWAEGFDRAMAALSASTSLVNVLSNPTLVVRDGVSATISVGNDIPTIGATTSDPIQSDRQTTVINYRKTGINLTVTPTVNAQGLVVLQIDQQISNTSETGPSLAGSPSIFERAIQTEVLAQSGQTILLGGLISENSGSSTSYVPGLGRIPLLGHLFSSRGENTEKTELVIFITPRVIDRVDQWSEIRARLSEGLTNLKIVD